MTLLLPLKMRTWCKGNQGTMWRKEVIELEDLESEPTVILGKTGKMRVKKSEFRAQEKFKWKHSTQNLCIGPHFSSEKIRIPQSVIKPVRFGKLCGRSRGSCSYSLVYGLPRNISVASSIKIPALLGQVPDSLHDPPRAIFRYCG